VSQQPAITLCSSTAHERHPADGVIVRRELEVLGRFVPLEAFAPSYPLPLAELAPLGWQICDRLMSLAAEEAAERGSAVSCRKGCWACCDMYILPLSAPEAFRLVADIEGLPPLARLRADQYFQQIAAILPHQATDLASEQGCSMAARTTWTVSEEWWRLHHRTCPMLDRATCVLYHRRPTACREFIATTPPELCRRYKGAHLSLGISVAFSLAEAAGILEGLPPALVPLPTLRTWYRDHGQRAGREFPAPLMVETLLDALSGQARRRSLR
jgi:Fe-S-cluster containining protein